MSIIDWEKAECRTEQLSDLWLDLNVYPRERPDPEVVASYAKAKLAGAEFPAIKVALYQGRKVIVDGYLLRQTTPKTQTSFTSTLDQALKLIKKWRTQTNE